MVAREHKDRHLLLAEAVHQLQREVAVINSTHITAAGRRRVFGVEGEREHVEEAIGDVGVVLVWLHGPEVTSGLTREARLVIEVEGGGRDRVARVDAGVVEPGVGLLVALAAHGPHDLRHGVVEAERHPDLAVARLDLVGLGLADEHLERRGGESLSFRILKIHIGRLDARRERLVGEAAAIAAALDDDVRARGDDAVLEARPLDVDGNAVELQRRQA